MLCADPLGELTTLPADPLAGLRAGFPGREREGRRGVREGGKGREGKGKERLSLSGLQNENAAVGALLYVFNMNE